MSSDTNVIDPVVASAIVAETINCNHLNLNFSLYWLDSLDWSWTVVHSLLDSVAILVSEILDLVSTKRFWYDLVSDIVQYLT